jgi:hypothetical protein
MPKLFVVQQDIDEVRRSYPETQASVKADADPACTVCGGKGLALGMVIPFYRHARPGRIHRPLWPKDGLPVQPVLSG